jgi:hypothetical protein
VHSFIRRFVVASGRLETSDLPYFFKFFSASKKFRVPMCAYLSKKKKKKKKKKKGNRKEERRTVVGYTQWLCHIYLHLPIGFSDTNRVHCASRQDTTRVRSK